MDLSVVKDNDIQFSSPECIRFYEDIEKFCKSLSIEKNYSQHTSRNYRNDLIEFNMWCDRMNFNPYSAKYRVLRQYLGELDFAQYARTTINRHLSSLRSFFKWLSIVGENTNDFADVLSGPKILKTLPHIIMNSDVEKLLSTSQDAIDQAKDEKEKAIAIRDCAILELLYATGARISEISNLLIDNINFESSQIKFFGKGKKERIVPIYTMASNALNMYIEQSRPILKNDKTPENICFIGSSGVQMSADSMRKMFYKKCNLAGITSNISPHSMRHTFATAILDGGADLRSVQEMLGHSSLSTTQIYTHLSTKKLKDVHSQAHPRG